MLRTKVITLMRQLAEREKFMQAFHSVVRDLNTSMASDGRDSSKES
jgi:hypothetical protein